MSRPRGRPFKLTPEQQVRVYQEFTAAKRGRRFQKLSDLADEFGVCNGTLERAVYRERKKHLASIAGRFHETPHKSPGA